MNSKPPGLRIESAASIVLEDTIKKYLHTFAHVIRTDRVAGQSVSGIAIDALAGVTALIIAGGHGSRSDVTEATIARLRDRINEDLQHLARQ